MILYKVDKDKRTVVAYFEGGRDYWDKCLTEIVEDAFTKSNMFIPYRLVNVVLDTCPVLCGKAKCCEEDVFDVDYGKRLARNRLIDKWNRVKRRVVDECYVYLDKEYQAISDKLFKAEG